MGLTPGEGIESRPRLVEAPCSHARPVLEVSPAQGQGRGDFQGLEARTRVELGREATGLSP